MTPAPARPEPIADAPTEGRRRTLSAPDRVAAAALLAALLAIYAPPDTPTPSAPSAPRPRPEA